MMTLPVACSLYRTKHFNSMLVDRLVLYYAQQVHVKSQNPDLMVGAKTEKFEQARSR